MKILSEIYEDFVYEIYEVLFYEIYQKFEIYGDRDYEDFFIKA